MDFSEILLVDDDRLYIEVVKRRLCNFGFQNRVKIFPYGGPALDYLKEIERQKTDQNFLVLLDLKMPIMSGWEFLNEFGKLDFRFKEQIKIVVITNLIGIDERNRAMAYKEVIGYYHKPFNKSSVRGILQDLEMMFSDD